MNEQDPHVYVRIGRKQINMPMTVNTTVGEVTSWVLDMMDPGYKGVSPEVCTLRKFGQDKDLDVRKTLEELDLEGEILRVWTPEEREAGKYGLSDEEHMSDEDELAELLSRALSRGLYVNVKTKEKYGYITLILRERNSPNAGTEESLEVTGEKKTVVDVANVWLSVTGEGA